MLISKERGETPWMEQASCIRPDRYHFRVMGPINWRDNLIPIILIPKNFLKFYYL